MIMEKKEEMILVVNIYWFPFPGWAVNMVFEIHLLCDIQRLWKLENNIKSCLTFCYNVFIVLLIRKELYRIISFSQKEHIIYFPFWYLSSLNI